MATGRTAGRTEAIAAARAFARPLHRPAAMARDFLFWRHLRVLRARAMRHVHRATGGALCGGKAAPVRSVYGVAMWPNWSDKTYAYCHYGTYGSYLADLIGALDVPFAFLDVGANQGLFSLIAGRNPACEAILALDPVPATHARLEANLAAAGLAGRAIALNVGLSERSGSATITLGRAHSGLATLGPHLAARSGDAARIDVALVTAARIVPHLPRHLPIFAKIDVEGHEAVVIDQLLGSALGERVCGLFYEHDDRWSDAARIERALARAGFAQRRRYGRGRHYDVLATPTY
ncbi:MAG: FkbM family methyltransferase [Erythrobacter sp.]|uniref:FkbM family methyltransferase n=1 Tax=Erythrobacter sp. TaxID=1042 RepID=UPI0032EC510E